MSLVFIKGKTDCEDIVINVAHITKITGLEHRGVVRIDLLNQADSQANPYIILHENFDDVLSTIDFALQPGRYGVFGIGNHSIKHM